MKYHHPPLHRPCGPVKPSRLGGGREIFLKGKDIFDLFSNLWYNKNEKHFKNETRRAGRLISYCGSSFSLLSFFIKNEIEDISTKDFIESRH